MVMSSRGREQFPKLSRLLGSPDLPPLFVSVFLCVSVMWVEIIVSVLVMSSVSESGDTDWAIRNLCGLSIWGAQGVHEHRAVRGYPTASSGMGWLSSCVPGFSVGVRVLTVTYSK